MKRRPATLLLALLATLAATWWASSLDEVAAPVAGPRAERPAPQPASQPAPRPASRAGTARATAAAGAELALFRDAWPASAAGILKPYSFRPEPGARAAFVAAAPVATLPPLPFRFVGALEDRGLRAVILMEGETVHIVRAGDRIGERYRIERTGPDALVFTYLPLRQRQVLDLSAHDSPH